jgi:hypothetical protein
LKVTGQRFSFHIRPWLALVFLAMATLLSATGCDLLPWHKQAEFENRVKNDSFPTADQALHPSVDANGNRTRDGGN